jgi:hypothetical protein
MMINSDQNSEHPYAKEWQKRETYTTTESFFSSIIVEGRLSDTNTDRARAKVLASVLQSLPWSVDTTWAKPHDRKEKFSFAHADLNLQNLLCDDEGNVTGILD